MVDSKRVAMRAFPLQQQLQNTLSRTQFQERVKKWAFSANEYPYFGGRTKSLSPYVALFHTNVLLLP